MMWQATCTFVFDPTKGVIPSSKRPELDLLSVRCQLAWAHEKLRRAVLGWGQGLTLALELNLSNSMTHSCFDLGYSFT